MPLFIMISGYLSKHIACQRQKDIAVLLYPYLIFQILNVLYVRYVEGGQASWNLFIPHHQNWFLLSLFTWRLIVPYFKNCRPIIGIFITLALSVLFSKYSIAKNVFSLTYTFVFFPFFIIGYYAKDNIEKIRFSIWKFFAAISIFVIIMVCLFGVSVWNFGYGIRLTHAFKPIWQCLEPLDYIMRYGGFCVALIISACLIYITTHILHKLKSNLNLGGENTMLIYVMHYFIVIPLWKVFPQYHPVISLLLSILLSFIICWFFSRDYIVQVFQPLLNFNYIKNKCRK